MAEANLLRCDIFIKIKYSHRRLVETKCSALAVYCRRRKHPEYQINHGSIYTTRGMGEENEITKRYCCFSVRFIKCELSRKKDASPTTRQQQQQRHWQLNLIYLNSNANILFMKLIPNFIGCYAFSMKLSGLMNPVSNPSLKLASWKCKCHSK